MDPLYTYVHLARMWGNGDATGTVIAIAQVTMMCGKRDQDPYTRQATRRKKRTLQAGARDFQTKKAEMDSRRRLARCKLCRWERRD